MAVNIGALILAGGKGTRMYSTLPKVLQPILGEPMLSYVYSALAPMFGEQILTVIGHRAELLRLAFPQFEDRFILQAEQLGTGHALQIAWPALREACLSHVLVVSGDVPLISKDTLTTFINAVERSQSPLGFITLTLRDPGAYGRVLRDNDGKVSSIIEAKDYDSAKYGPEPNEINAGIYCLEIERIEPLLPLLRNKNKSGEFYITDLVSLAAQSDLDVIGVQCGDDETLLGINNPRELIRTENIVREEIVRDWLDAGVFIHMPEAVRIGPDVVLEPGARVQGPCQILGASRIAAHAEVEAFCHLNNASLGEGAVVRSFSHLENAVLEAGAIAGPYARLRPGARLEKGSRVGNFVEVKNATLGPGAKAGHLTYLGDAHIGEGANIGAGTITCNYDGHKKHRTTIGPGAFIGSNTALVAPVTIGKGSIVGAGSTITKDVPENTLALTRPEQINKPRRQKPTEEKK